MANQVAIMSTLISEYSTHTFNEKELSRFTDETTAEVNGYFPKESAALVKAATLTKKGLTLKLHALKLTNAAMRPRLVIFVAMVQAASLSATCGYTIRADVTEACDVVRRIWERKDAAKANGVEDTEEVEA